MEDQYCMENSLKTGEQQWKEDYIASPGVRGVEDQFRPFPKAVFHLDPYKLVYVCLPIVEPQERILSTISLSNGSSAMIVLKSDVRALEREFGMICPRYNIELSKEDVDLFGSVEAAQNQRISALSRMFVDAILRDSTLEARNCIDADPSYVLKLLTIWLKKIASQWKEESPAFLKPADVNIDVEAGRQSHTLLDGTFDFASYTLVRLSDVGDFTESEISDVLDTLANLGEILSIEELPDGSFELPVLKSYFPSLKDQVGKIFPGCNIELDIDPTEPNEQEVKMFGSSTATILRTATFYDRAERMEYEAWPKAAAFYLQLKDAVRHGK